MSFVLQYAVGIFRVMQLTMTLRRCASIIAIALLSGNDLRVARLPGSDPAFYGTFMQICRYVARNGAKLNLAARRAMRL